jgi:hypothetical protein
MKDYWRGALCAWMIPSDRVSNPNRQRLKKMSEIIAHLEEPALMLGWAVRVVGFLH